LKHITTVQSKINDAAPLTSKTVKSIAHRGDITIAPQNTAPSYILARKEGHTIAENDVWVSADGEYVMEHDTNLSRLGNLVDINGYEMYTDGSTFYYYDTDNSQLYTYTTDYVASSVDVATLTRCDGANYAVTGLTIAVLKRIDFGVYMGSQFKGIQILTFAEWILLMKRLGMDAYIDRKIGYTVPIVTELANIVKEYGMLDHVSWIGVPAIDTIEAIRTVDPNARIGILEHPNSANVVTYAPYNTGRGFFFNGNANDGLTKAAVQTGINAGFEVETYYVGYDYPAVTETDIFTTISNALSYGVTGMTLDHYRVDDAVQSMLDEYHIR
jgi:glycerophosphoryl diester phosphodiesterase